MALWVRTLREPIRGLSEGIVTPQHPNPVGVLLTESAAMIPILNLFGLARVGASIPVNLIGALIIALCAWGLTTLTGSVIQWIALGIGIYVVFSWVQSLKARDPVTYHMIFELPTYLCHHQGLLILN